MREGNKKLGDEVQTDGRGRYWIGDEQGVVFTTNLLVLRI
jgi:hypothetical protein